MSNSHIKINRFNNQGNENQNYIDYKYLEDSLVPFHLSITAALTPLIGA